MIVIRGRFAAQESLALDLDIMVQLSFKKTTWRNEIRVWKTDLTIPGIYESEF